jgi:hypothetical protein
MQVHKNTYKEERGEADTAQVEFVFAIPVAVAVPLLYCDCGLCPQLFFQVSQPCRKRMYPQ